MVYAGGRRRELSAILNIRRKTMKRGDIYYIEINDEGVTGLEMM